MSNPLENKSQISSEEFKEMRVNALHSKLASILKLLVTKSISKMTAPSQVNMVENTSEEALAVPIPVNGPEDQAADAATTDTAAPSRGAGTKSTVVGEHLFSFKLPGPITKKMNLDKLTRDRGNPSPVHEFSFSERLEGWIIERRHRENGRCDVLYRHSKSSGIFRSNSEVVSFMMYEIYPENQRKENKDDNNRKRKSTSSDEDVRKQEVSEEEIMKWEYELQGFSAAEEISNVDKAENEGVIGANYSDELDLINHIPICGSLDELVEFLVNNQRKGQE